MRNIKAFLFTTMLFALGMGSVAWAQIAKIEMLTAAEPAAREGGKSEAAGDVFLDVETDGGASSSIASFTLTYSAPLAAGTTEATIMTSTNVTIAATDIDIEKGTIKAVPGGSNDHIIQIQDVELDVSKAEGPVTVTVMLESAENGVAFLVGSDTMTVITEILPGVKVTAEPGTVRTRGTPLLGVEAVFTIEEGFNGAFEVGQRVEFEVSGLPEAVTVAFVPSDPAADPTSDPAILPYSITPESGTLTGDADGDDKSDILTLGIDAATGDNREGAPPKFNLKLTLSTSGDDVSLPLMMGDIEARVTLTDTVAGTDDFEDAPTSRLAVFEIRPAQCKLLFPYAARLPGMAWNTGISVMNPGYGEGRNAGGLTFTFYGNDGSMAEFSTEMYSNVGSGLDEMGLVPAGGTYTILASEILSATGWGERFVGHIHVLADYTECNGVGWVTDFGTVNQAYVAVVVDSDTGKD